MREQNTTSCTGSYSAISEQKSVTDPVWVFFPCFMSVLENVQIHQNVQLHYSQKKLSVFGFG